MIENGWVLTVDADVDYQEHHWEADRTDELVLEFSYTDDDMCIDALAEHLGIEGKFDRDAMYELMDKLRENDQADILTSYIGNHKNLQDEYHEWYSEKYHGD